MKISFNWRKKSKSSPLGFVIEQCLTKDEADKLLHLDFEQLLDMESEDRIKVFAQLIGEQKAQFVNSRLEQDVILKNQKEGLMKWINGCKDVEPKWRNEIVREISSLDRALSKKEEDAFIEKLANLMLGMGITLEERHTIYSLAQKAQEAKNKMEAGSSVADYEKALKIYKDYVDSLKPE